MTLSPEEFKIWQEKDERRLNTRSAKHIGTEWEDVLKIAQENLPESAPPLPYELTPEGQRLAGFRKVCPEEFMARIRPEDLKNAPAFNSLKAWNGAFRGPIAHGATGTGKTRASWSILGELHVKQGLSLAWFPVKRLITEFLRYEQKDLADEFWKMYGRFDLLFVDDADKINWSFDSEQQALFQFYDWIYRAHRPCVTTTNCDEKWWTKKMGDAFTRRLFHEAHYPVNF
jgi:DNA replication protein DnaC